ncbi:MAG: nucleoside 2-deoxyribosyltransferase domain-containing protein [Candidatus Micrarchaeota archaeon]|nr:nucleoside 2-deoxyribosyltransferase domain-containing protein [Candidatus Micrarchaeota archaeon]MDE1804719.1 nucleoside 2-deoxyribosyltransferase domain-containing protein [Candidatus Micrarchaeota archaeon]
MDQAREWQSEIVRKLKDANIVILNPRRENWDSSWKQELSDRNFVGQVEWELDAIEMADLVAVHFEPDTKSPITMLEIGLFAKSDPKKLIIHCPEGFWRKGNIDIVCRRYGIKQVETLDELAGEIRGRSRD